MGTIMQSITRGMRALLLIGTCLILPLPALAQPASGGLASIGGSAVFGGESTDAAVTAAVGYRVNPTLAVTIELTALPDLTPELPDAPDFVIATATPLIFPTPFPEYSAEGGQGTFVTGTLRLELPSRGGLQPYLVAGAGAGSIVERVRARFTYPPFPLIAPDLIAAGFRPPIALPSPLVLPAFEEVVETSSTGFATTFGGGIAFRISQHLTFDLDVRYLALLGEGDRHLARIGGGLTARF